MYSIPLSFFPSPFGRGARGEAGSPHELKNLNVPNSPRQRRQLAAEARRR